jgi:hypothetical protein
MKNKLWCDLKTDNEKVEFLRSGRAWETGIIAKSIVEDVAQAFERPLNKVVEDGQANDCITFNKCRPAKEGNCDKGCPFYLPAT